MNMVFFFFFVVIVVMLYMVSVIFFVFVICFKVEDIIDKCRNFYFMINNKWYMKGSFD